MAGYTCDATCWVTADPASRPKAIPFELFDAGFDVWLASNRGTKYSTKHTSLDWTEPEYWSWSWAEMGLYDVPANIDLVLDKTGAPRVSYIGYSQGTIQMFYALTHIEESYLAERLYTFVALAPCSIALPDGSESVMTEGVFHLGDIGVYAFNGPNWESDKIKVCETYSSDVCDYVSSYDGEPVSVRTDAHWN